VPTLIALYYCDNDTALGNMESLMAWQCRKTGGRQQVQPGSTLEVANRPCCAGHMPQCGSTSPYCTVAEALPSH